ncbi:phosphoserine transaminase [Tremella mesenterica]|uniref:phosphoserine transaminase n=1 Tax=Tremella mesenterica TaxID=5217 RepID=A0A4Q1BQY9_TREME|nr:uncharacterized protein TREMEDRAFT_33737 [Tremella mesenterica DSM 1558]EIW67239.1 hypothetical protein TREMEDRAFT_33737 [Tremella mesenterica DSM 1558]RXK40363.1 phosphoserine transaminase [Tremella mesenterica]
MERSQVHNFAAGPSPLPTSVLEEAARGLVNYQGTGMGICELSHRGKEFKGIISGAEADIHSLLSVPDNYSILFSQGGGTSMFSSIILNLLAAHRLSSSNISLPASSYTPPNIDYIITGSWSSKAYSEAVRLCSPSSTSSPTYAIPHIAANTKPTGYTTLPSKEEYKFSSNPAYIYYCENETINGVQYSLSDEFSFPFDMIPSHIPIVADYSSSFLSRPIPHLNKHAVIFAGAQKNLGPAGVTVLIVRNDLLVDTSLAYSKGGVIPTPIGMEWKIMAENGSLYNTPPVFAIYVCALVLKELVRNGGMEKMKEINEEKAKRVYQVLDKVETIEKMKGVVREKKARSWMNVTFEIIEREEDFFKGAEERGLRQLKGHRSVGGGRASLYNAVGLESVDKLCEWILEFSRV